MTRHRYRPVAYRSLAGPVSFASMADAAREMGTDVSSIRKSLRTGEPADGIAWEPSCADPAPEEIERAKREVRDQAETMG